MGAEGGGRQGGGPGGGGRGERSAKKEGAENSRCAHRVGNKVYSVAGAISGPDDTHVKHGALFSVGAFRCRYNCERTRTRGEERREAGG